MNNIFDYVPPPMPVPPLSLNDNETPFRLPLYGGIVPPKPKIETNVVLSMNKETPAEKNKLQKPSILFILTGLGRYSLYKLPFLKKHIFCASLPSVLMFHIARIFRFERGNCKCDKASCRYIGIFNLYIGLCKQMKNDKKQKVKNTCKF